MGVAPSVGVAVVAGGGVGVWLAGVGVGVWLAGGGIRGGMTYGATDEVGFAAIDRQCLFEGHVMKAMRGVAGVN